MKRVLFLALLVSSVTIAGAETPTPFNDDCQTTVSGIKSVKTSGDDAGTTVVIPATPATTPQSGQTAATVPQPKPEVKPEVKAETAPAAKKTYKVVKGDTLWGIAQKLLGDGSRFPEIVAANKENYPSLLKNPNLILEGWVLEVPEDKTQSGSGSQGQAGQTGAVASPGGTKPGSGTPAGTPAQNPVNSLSTEQKQQKLQDAVKQLAAALMKEGKAVKGLDQATIDEMIKRKIISEQDWQGLNPPIDHYWALDGLKVVLKKKDGTTVSTSGTTTPSANAAADKAAAEKAAADKVAAEKAAAAKAAAEKAAAEKTAAAKAAAEKAAAEKAAADKAAAEKAAAAKAAAEKAAAEKAAAEKAAAEKAAAAKAAAGTPEGKFAEALKSLGMPDVYKGGDMKPYRDAISMGSEYLLPGDWAKYSPLLKFHEMVDPYSDLHVLQTRLMEAQKLYAEKVNSNDVRSGWIVFGDSIETAAKKVEEAKAALAKKWNEFKPIYRQAVDAGKAAQADLKKLQEEIGPARKRLEELKAKGDPGDAGEITSLIKKCNDFEDTSRKLQQKVDAMGKMTAVFGNP